MTRVFGYGAGGVGAQEDFNEVVFESLKFKAVAKANPSWLAAKGVVGEPDCPPAVAGGCALVRTTPHPSVWRTLHVASADCRLCDGVFPPDRCLTRGFHFPTRRRSLTTAFLLRASSGT